MRTSVVSNFVPAVDKGIAFICHLQDLLGMRRLSDLKYLGTLRDVESCKKFKLAASSIIEAGTSNVAMSVSG